MEDIDENSTDMCSKSSDISESSIITREIINEENEQLYKNLSRESRLKLEEEQKKLDRDKALKAIRYLLNSSELYSGFIKNKLNEVREERNLKESVNETSLRKKRKLNNLEEISVKDIINDNENYSKESTTSISKQPVYFEGGTLRNYQMDGLVWLKLLYENGLNGILADEMGLGKTVQVIALICHLIEECILGPFLIVAPLSTIPNWISEFKRFAPKIPVILFHGNKTTRKSLYESIRRTKYPVGEKKVSPVVITTYQIPLIETNFLEQFLWKYIIVDEAQRIKNHETQLSRILSSLKSSNRLILTGTPLQNNLKELWSLLNFLVPQIFPDSRMFTALLELDDFKNVNKIIKNEEETQVISTLHKVLAPFMLRRLKNDVLPIIIPKKEVYVYCPLTKHQYLLHQAVLDYNIEILTKKEKETDVNETRQKRNCTKNQENPSELLQMKFNDLMEYYYQKQTLRIEKKEKSKEPTIATRITMARPVTMLEKIFNHPYLVQMPITYNSSNEKEIVIDENLVTQSGKMMVFDALITRLKQRHHKVLVFSTFVMMLDLLEEYFLMRKIKYSRLDGSKSLEKRQDNINKFNKDPRTFAFLISTRAGGLGLNLISADTVILFNSDWNPQMDLQAQDRCHRIGQTKPIIVYRLVAKGTYDENIVNCANAKRCLEKAIISNENNFSKISYLQELKALLNFQNQMKIYPNGFILSDNELDRLLDRSDLWKEMEENKNKHPQK